MKTPYNIILLLLIVFTISIYKKANAQTWIPDGAEWQLSFTRVYSEGFYRVYYDADTLVDNIITKRLYVEEISKFYTSETNHYVKFIIDTILTYQDNDKIYIYKWGEFKVLFDFSLNVGDSTKIYGESGFEDNNDGIPCDSVTDAVVDSVGWVTLNNQTLRYYTLSYGTNASWKYNGRIYEKIGHAGYFLPYKADMCGLYLHFQATLGNLECYRDNVFGEYSFGELDCDDALSIKSKKEIEIKIYPNPTSGILNILFTENKEKIEIASIYNISGQKVHEFDPDLVPTTLDLSFLPKGIYFINLNSKSQNYHAKIIISD
jgi:hypothetical protein